MTQLSHEISQTGDTTPQASLNALLDEAGWSRDMLTTAQLALLSEMLSEQRILRQKISDLEAELESAHHFADHDALIPVYNRRAFTRELSRQLSFCYRYEAPACLIYLDLDRFKQINDRLGHATGDEALRKFGEILIAHTRESDLVGRIGGDEFAVLLINADEEAGAQKAHMFREDTLKLRFGPAHDRLGFGLSCGIIAWERGETAEHLLNRGDEAMYAQKLRQR